MKKFLIVLAVILGLFLLYFWGSYNRLVTANENIQNQWAQVETQYQRRFDLIPNLVESVKGIMQQEQAIFIALAEARTRYSGAQTVTDKAKAASGVESALARLLVIMENYPELKSADTVQTLMSQLEGTENRISVERKRYNDTVRDYNMLIKRIPGRFVAALFDFNEVAYFEAVAGSETAPSVKF